MKYSSQSYSILRSNEVVAAVVLQKPRVPVTFSPQLYPFLPEVNPGDLEFPVVAVAELPSYHSLVEW